MAQLYTAGEKKQRPGVYFRYSNRGKNPTAGAMDGVNAIVIAASWGPVGTVTTHATVKSLEETYGKGPGVEAAKMLFAGGATKVYVCRPEGSGSVAGTATVGGITVTAKHPGARALSVKVQEKVGDATKKQLIILDGTTALETFEFAVNETDETAAVEAAMASSKIVDVAVTATGVVPVGTIALEGGVDPTYTAEDYLKGFHTLELYRYNVLTTDSLAAEVVSTLKTYVAECERKGKLIMCVIGSDSGVAFEDRMAAAKACNDKQIVYIGSGYVDSTGAKVEGVLMVNYAAGVISSTTSNHSIVHSVVSDAVDVTEHLTMDQYEEAIGCGLLLLSMGPDGQIWFDSGINTLLTLSENEDAGWKKIKRVKVRYELMDRIDRAVAPLVGKINCDADGVAAVIQAGMGVIGEMIAERKIFEGATMIVDPDNPYEGDSAWFLIQVDDIDSLEKIYLHYQFRYSQNA